MAYTKQEEAVEFWMLSKGILQDSKIDIDEAKVIRRWLEEHRAGDSFDMAIARLNKFLSDGYIDPFESKDLVDMLGTVLRTLRQGATRV